MAVSRWAVLAVLAMTVAAGVALANPGDTNERTTVVASKCGVCHAPDAIPFKVSAQLILPDGLGANVGQPFDLTGTLQNAWRQEYEMVHAEVTLDISKAPALQFSSSIPPERIGPNATAITLDPATPQATKGTSILYTIKGGASSVTFTVTPSDPPNANTGPVLTMTVQKVGDDEVKRFPAAGPGQPITQTFEGADAAAYAGGGVMVGAETQMVSSGTPPRVLTSTTVNLEIQADAAYNLVGLTQLTVPVSHTLLGGASTLVSWPLQVQKDPGAGEVVTILLNSTGYYDHNHSPSDSVDWWNYTEPGKDAAVTPMTMEVLKVGDKVVLKPQTIELVQPEVLNGPTIKTISEAVGYASAMLLISSIWSGGMFGKASRRSLNVVFGSAKRRVAFHNFLSYGIILAAGVHIVLFILETFYHWTVGLIWGGAAMVAMLGLGVTGALQVPMIRKWSYGAWRWSHYGFTIAVLLFTVAHGLLDGAHFEDVQKYVHWSNPLGPTNGS